MTDKTFKYSGITTTGIHQLYKDAKQADQAYHNALAAAYGKHRAGDMRYAQVLPTSIALLRTAKREADEAYLNACRALRDDQG